LHPGKAIIDTAKNTILLTLENSLRMAKPGKIIDTEEIIDPGEETVRTLNPEKITNTAKIIDTD
jgi:hypothetical protein